MQGGVSQRRISLDSLFNLGVLFVGDAELKASRPTVGLIMVGKQLLHIRGWGSPGTGEKECEAAS